ncbi:PREDICTED: toxin MIT1-like [Branchiostoma belcheri]|uniref:Toxin MIT1-like n=1 Tax=Branchiostoma belcheri TaxID=7741 RepID=A0A6P4YLY9_BRABE|nr:PREDICTED: toxin MIT1-like [Branchiostoma belcheri]
MGMGETCVPARRIPAAAALAYLLLLLLLQCHTGAEGYVTTGVCEDDYQCMRALGGPACCAPWGRSIPIPVCKEMGQRGEPCHMASNRMPYPLRIHRVFWRCPCGENLTCASTGLSRIGVCMHTM